LGEVVVLSSFGGLIGIALALAGSPWLSDVPEVPFVFNGGNRPDRPAQIVLHDLGRSASFHTT
jgi:hypothetical protein